MRENFKKVIKKKAIIQSLMVLSILLLGISAKVVYSNAQFNIKIEYLAETFEPRDNMENKLFFNSQSQSEISFEVDFSGYYADNKGTIEAAGEVKEPFSIEAKLNDVNIDNVNIEKILLENGSFDGKYKVKFTVPAGDDGDKVNIVIKTDVNNWGIDTSLTTNFGIIRDIVKPEIIVEGISDNSTVADRVFISLNDNYKETATMTVNIELDGVPIQQNGDYENPTKIEINPTTDGDYIGKVTAKDKAGNIANEKEINFYINQNSPTITFNDDVIKSFYNNGEILIKIFDDSKINFTESKYILKSIDDSGSENLIEEKNFTEINSKNGEVALNITNDGKYQLEVTAVDSKGTIKDTKDIFTIDTEVPGLTISGIVDKGVYSESQTVIIAVEDKNFKNITINDEIIGKDKLVQDKDNANIYTYSYEVSANEGENKEVILNIGAEDEGGLTSQESRSFVIDKKKPTIEFSGVENETYYNTDKKLTIEVNDEYLTDNNISIECIKYSDDSDETGTKVDLGVFSKGILTHTFDNGKYVINVNAIDDNGNTESKTITFIIDKDKPVVTINNDILQDFNTTTKDIIISVNEKWFKSTTVNVDITQEIDKNDINSIENNLPLAWEKNQIDKQQTYSFNKDGKYTITVKVKDKANEEVVIDPITFVIDKTAPEIKIDGVDDGKYYNSDKEITIKTIDNNHDQNNITVTKDGKPYNVGEFPTEGTDRVINHTFSENGDYEIQVTSTDMAGLTNEKTVNFTIDKDRPVLQIKDKNTNEDIKSGKHYDKVKNIEIVLSDENFQAYSLKINGKEEEFNKDIDSKVLTYNLDANVDGVYDLEVQAIDKAGNTLTENGEASKTKFTIDTTKPIVNIENVEALNNSFNKKLDSVKVNINEINFDKEKLQVTINKKEPNKESEIITIDGKDIEVSEINKVTGEYSFVLNNMFIDDAIYDITVDIEDIVGNEIDPISKNKVLFTVDNTKPSINISNPKDKTYYKDEAINLEVRIDDNNHNINKVMIEKVYKELGKEAKVVTEEYTDFVSEGTEKVFKISLKDEATYNVTVYSMDKAGNVSETKEAHSFVIDRTEPVIETNFEEINGTYSNPQKTATIKISEVNWKNKYDGKALLAVVTGKKTTPDMNVQDINLSFELKGEVTEVSYTNEFADDAIYDINVAIADITGKEAKSQSVQFVTDKTTPDIRVEGVENNEYYNMDRPVVITSTDVNHNVNKITVTKDGNSYSVGDFVLSGREAIVKHTFTQEGEYEIFVSSTDKAGNTTTHPVVKFTIDKTAPVITPLNKSENRVLVNGEYINKVFNPEFKLDKEEDTIDLITLNGEGNYANSVLMASKEMVYNYKVVASDKAKNTTTLDITFTLDTTSPEVKVSGILSGFFSDNMKPTYDITDTNLDKDRTIATLNGEPFESGTLIKDQNHYNLKFVGTDLANNVTTRTIGFAIDKDKPVIRFVEAISGEYFTEDFIPNFVIDDLTDYTIIAMTLDGEDYEVGDMITEEGKHVLYIEVKDQAGNIESVSVEFILDKTPPKFIIDGVKNNKKYFETVNAKIKLDNPQDTIKSIEVNGELAQGDIKEENGQQVVNLNFNEIKEYELKLVAVDEAGNLTEEIINFEIAEKNLFVKMYQNKAVFYPSVVVVVAAVSAIGFTTLGRFKKKDIKQDKNEEDRE